MAFPLGKGLGAPVPAQLASSSVEERVSRRGEVAEAYPYRLKSLLTDVYVCVPAPNWSPDLWHSFALLSASILPPLR